MEIGAFVVGFSFCQMNFTRLMTSRRVRFVAFGLFVEDVQR